MFLYTGSLNAVCPEQQTIYDVQVEVGYFFDRTFLSGFKIKDNEEIKGFYSIIRGFLMLESGSILTMACPAPKNGCLMRLLSPTYKYRVDPRGRRGAEEDNLSQVLVAWEER